MVVTPMGLPGIVAIFLGVGFAAAIWAFIPAWLRVRAQERADRQALVDAARESELQAYKAQIRAEKGE